MKAKLTRQKLYEVCHIKARDKKLIDDELTELEILADIGRATEKAMVDGILLPNAVCTGSGYVEGVGDPLLSVEELLEWAKGGK